MEPLLAESGVRLLQAMQSEQDAKVLGPSLIREIYYRVLNGPASEMLCRILQAGNGRSRVYRVLKEMRTNLAAPFDVETTARSIGMSSSAFHEHFRAVMETSPVRYLKSLRLHRARALMLQENASVAEASGKVGYVSQSQFSREFKRLFGRSPLEETRRIRTSLTETGN